MPSLITEARLRALANKATDTSSVHADVAQPVTPMSHAVRQLLSDPNVLRRALREQRRLLGT